MKAKVNKTDSSEKSSKLFESKGSSTGFLLHNQN